MERGKKEKDKLIMREAPPRDLSRRCCEGLDVRYVRTLRSSSFSTQQTTTAGRVKWQTHSLAAVDYLPKARKQ